MTDFQSFTAKCKITHIVGFHFNSAPEDELCERPFVNVLLEQVWILVLQGGQLLCGGSEQNLSRILKPKTNLIVFFFFSLRDFPRWIQIWNPF